MIGHVGKNGAPWLAISCLLATAFHLSFGKIEGKQTTRSGIGAEEEGATCVHEDRYRRCGILSAFGWNHARGDGRTPTHDSRIFAAQQPSLHKQVPAGDIEDQALGTRQTSRRDFADGYFAKDKPNPVSVVCERFRMAPFSSGAHRPLISPDLVDTRTVSA